MLELSFLPCLFCFRMSESGAGVRGFMELGWVRVLSDRGGGRE